MYIPMNEKEYDPIVFVCRGEVGSKTLAKGGFFSERADAFVISPNSRT